MAASLIDQIVAKFHAEKRFRPRGWDRDDVVRFFARKSGKDSFGSLPAYSDVELSPESIARKPLKGWQIPEEAFAMKNPDGSDPKYVLCSPDESLKNSLRAFIRDNVLRYLPQYGGPTISPESVELHLTGDGENCVVMVYRRKAAD